ncbi:hypothetical protein ABW19_dt0206045 [Dactylella cylindrospora]|nr:hypothetical protein ABW19_dt0206045 [Dactylella cylindrospora]
MRIRNSVSSRDPSRDNIVYKIVGDDGRSLEGPAYMLDDGCYQLWNREWFDEGLINKIIIQSPTTRGTCTKCRFYDKATSPYEDDTCDPQTLPTWQPFSQWRASFRGTKGFDDFAQFNERQPYSMKCKIESTDGFWGWFLGRCRENWDEEVPADSDVGYKRRPNLYHYSNLALV